MPAAFLFFLLLHHVVVCESVFLALVDTFFMQSLYGNFAESLDKVFHAVVQHGVIEVEGEA